MIRKPLVVMDLSSTGKDGGPYISSIRIMNSDLNKKYEFKSIIYRTEMGRNISIKRILDLRNQLLAINPDIVHFTGLQLSGLHVAPACKLAGVKNSIVTIHGSSGDALDINAFIRIILKYLFEPMTLLLTKKFYGVSDYVVSRRMAKLFSRKCFGTIYNLAPSRTALLVKNRIRVDLGLSSEDTVAVSVGRITKDKGYHILAEAILQFKETATLKFIIVGIGEYLPEMVKKLEKQISSGQVFFLGYRSDVQQILGDCDFFILPTLHETLSIALLEASMEDLALVASNTGGIPEIIENQYNGILVKPGSVNELVGAIEKLFSDYKLRTLYGENAKIRVLEKFSNAETMKKLDKLYQSLLSPET